MMPIAVAIPFLRWMSGCSIMVLLSSLPQVGVGGWRTAPTWVWFSDFGHGGDYVSADGLERQDPVHAGNEADYRLYPHPREPAQLSQFLPNRPGPPAQS